MIATIIIVVSAILIVAGVIIAHFVRRKSGKTGCSDCSSCSYCKDCNPRAKHNAPHEKRSP